MANLKDKIAKFVEEESKHKMNEALLERMQVLAAQDTLYWTLPPEKRNAFNAFFKELHSELESEMIDGEYGASIIIDSIIVTAFETGYRLGKEEAGKS